MTRAPLERRVQGHDVAGFEQFVEAGRAHPGAGDRLVHECGVVGPDLDAERRGAPRHGAADPPKPDEPEAQIVESPERAGGAGVPDARAHRTVEEDGAAREPEDEGHRGVRDLVRAEARDIADPDAPGARLRERHVVEADARGDDQAQVRHAREVLVDERMVRPGQQHHDAGTRGSPVDRLDRHAERLEGGARGTERVERVGNQDSPPRTVVLLHP